MNVTELRTLAKQHNIKGYSKMKKEDLLHQLSLVPTEQEITKAEESFVYEAPSAEETSATEAFVQESLSENPEKASPKQSHLTAWITLCNSKGNGTVRYTGKAWKDIMAREGVEPSLADKILLALCMHQHKPLPVDRKKRVAEAVKNIEGWGLRVIKTLNR